jgi:hypothetical protein
MARSPARMKAPSLSIVRPLGESGASTREDEPVGRRRGAFAAVAATDAERQLIKDGARRRGGTRTIQGRLRLSATTQRKKLLVMHVVPNQNNERTAGPPFRRQASASILSDPRHEAPVAESSLVSRFVSRVSL